MEDIFKENITRHNVFSWKGLGNIAEGRPRLGSTVPLGAFQMMDCALLETLHAQIGRTQTLYFYLEAGRLAGSEFAAQRLGLANDATAFFARFEAAWPELDMGALTVVHFSPPDGSACFSLALGRAHAYLTQLPTRRCFLEGFFSGALAAWCSKSVEAALVPVGADIWHIECHCDHPQAEGP